MRRTLLWLVLGLMLLAGCRGQQARPLKPGRPSPTPSPLVLDGIPRPAAFPDLGANPRVFLNQLIQVTGSYTRLTPAACDVYKGPRIVWGLVADNLQLSAAGYEAVLELVPAGTTLTVEGFWRFYVGPLGCGKEPSSEGLWYLDVQRIVQPNPLTRAGATGQQPLLVAPTPTESVGSLDTPLPTAVFTPTAAAGNGGGIPVVTPTASPTPTPITVAVPSPTGGAVLPTATPTVTAPSTLTPPTTPTPSPSPTPAGDLPVVSPSPTSPALPTLPSGPGTSEPCPYPGDEECKPTSTPYP